MTNEQFKIAENINRERRLLQDDRTKVIKIYNEDKSNEKIKYLSDLAIKLIDSKLYQLTHEFQKL